MEGVVRWDLSKEEGCVGGAREGQGINRQEMPLPQAWNLWEYLNFLCPLYKSHGKLPVQWEPPFSTAGAWQGVSNLPDTGWSNYRVSTV